ncbi:hypothetical protein [Mitsuaria sp. GD03876]|uniref:hypothetical protein n=1 Tax=Mitsuaria sp. GD03876 TaxID=2975399 RepID=UPI00244D0DFE|nr:hypothetical protein [Mitsuaria sp. GD03876]MDH0863753.1 hypothetical protein [Mitsuaria sp. GD03876]
MAYTIYVNGSVSEDGNFADCTYWQNADMTGPIIGPELRIPQNAGECVFTQVDDPDLLLIGATFKTIGSAPGMNASNFAPANDENSVSFSMPANPITKGVVLLFSTPGTVQNLYPSSDPQVINDQPPTC